MIENMIPGTEIEKPRVELVGKDGNAFAILGSVRRALRKARAPTDVIDKYLTEAMGSDYDSLLRVTMKYVDVV